MLYVNKDKNNNDIWFLKDTGDYIISGDVMYEEEVIDWKPSPDRWCIDVN